MIRKIAFVLACMFTSVVYAQELKVVKFEETKELDAVVYAVNDFNGNPCALIKIGLTADGVTFEGDVIKSEKKGNEYWVYMPESSYWLNINTPNTTPLRYQFAPVKKNITYVMVLQLPDQRPSVLPVELRPVGILGGDAGKSVKFNMLLVKAGRFKMGATEEQVGADEDEHPVHWCRISKDFYMAETEVTQELWEFVMGSNPSVLKGKDLPVENVSWNDCQAFIQKLNDMTKAKFRLPTEAEWEYVARGGNKTMRYLYSGSNNLDEVAWHYGNSQNSSRPVKSKKPNELGFYDMSGNVWELCWDYKQEYPKREVTDYVCTDKTKNRVRRGGGWDSGSNDKRVSFRRRIEPDSREASTGLRLVMAID
ncbi:MAG: SUMF1/EgtB/PvdO family nonheme iron enzyme [Muribaculaceae bacterium]|nr:SUMF1/EgtB/PvdO family nonheme iron enzyme [Muribaculaceae bacterium]